MGCRISKPELVEGLPPMCIIPLRNKMDEIKRSQTNNAALHSKDGEEELDAAKVAPVNDGEATVTGEEEEEGELGYADMPKSPSFRVYHLNSVGYSENEELSNENTVVNKQQNHNGAGDEKSAKRTDRIVSLISHEGSECKSQKKEKGRRLKALAKGPVAVYSCLNVRSWYNTSSDDSHRLLTEKNV